MFRFVGLAWDAEHANGHAYALRLANGLETSSQWQSALDRPGLKVFVTGAHPAINSAYRLSDAGVVLGRVFRRGTSSATNAWPPDTSVDGEVDRILSTGGRALVEDHWGRYVGFLPSRSTGTRVLRDPSGALPCFIRRHEGVWIIFSWLEDVLQYLPTVPSPPISWDNVAAMATYWELGGRLTALDGVTQVMPGEAVDLHGETARPTPLWSAVDIAGAASMLDSKEAALALREAVRQCTRSWADTYDKLLLRLSGGVDSSILLSCLSRDACDADVICVNYHSPGSDSDERAYARLAAGKADRRLVERERDAEFPLERVLDVARMPAPVHYLGRMGSTRMDAELAARFNVGAMFTGVGGDQLFFELRRWWPAADYLRVRGFDAGFLSAAMDAARLGQLSVWQTIALAVANRASRDPSNAIERTRATLVDTVHLNDLEHLARTGHPTLFPTPDLPIGKLNQARLLLSPLGYYDPFERDAAPEQVSPLLSQPIVEFCLRLPTYLLTLGGRGRGLARTAFEADLPPEIATRRSKGGIDDHIKKVLLQNLVLARGILLDGELVRRRILDRSKLEKALSLGPTTSSSSVAELHVLIGIEAWILKHRSSGGPLPHATAADAAR